MKMSDYVSMQDAEYREGYVASYARFMLKYLMAPFIWFKEWRR